jgi:hypothetical protein
VTLSGRNARRENSYATRYSDQQRIEIDSEFDTASIRIIAGMTAFPDDLFDTLGHSIPHLVNKGGPSLW